MRPNKRSTFFIKGTPPLSGHEKQNFFDFLFFIHKYTLKCPLSICEKKKYLAKNRNSILFYVFLKTIFFTKKVQNRPRFSAPVHPIELKLFFTDTRDTLGCLFFFVLENIVLSIFGRYYKKSCSWKTRTFKGALGILTFFLERNEIERKKNKCENLGLNPSVVCTSKSGADGRFFWLTCLKNHPWAH